MKSPLVVGLSGRGDKALVSVPWPNEVVCRFLAGGGSWVIHVSSGPPQGGQRGKSSEKQSLLSDDQFSRPGKFTRRRYGRSPRLNRVCKTARCRRSRWTLSFLIAASRASGCWLACRGTCRGSWGRVTRKSLYSSLLCNCGPTPPRKLLRLNCRAAVATL